ncbi:MAG: trypsin-like peptidase domain-containing protein [Rivularia sp. T60_A2020_040]|nr:trypsin-like peptidase domain-containing protein [Rivularia sp. T60_A2020_040]
MKFINLPKSVRQLSTHLFAILIGVLLSVNTLSVLPSQAEPAPIAQTPSNAAAAKANSSFVTAAVNRVGSAVVRIDTERTVSRRLPDPFMEDPFFRRFFGDSLPRNLPPEQLRGLGSGFIIDKSGFVLTNAHVVDKADKVTVRLKDGREFEGKVQGVDEVTDLAVVKIDAGSDLPVAPLGSSSEVQVGDWAIAVGNPLGFDNTVTLGIVSTLKRPSSQVGISSKRLEFIQTDAAINPGNSGGPLLNELGEVIGINTAIRADATGIGFAIPIDKAKQITSELQRNGKVAHPFIGIGMDDLTPSEARRINANPNSPIQVPEVQGVLVGRVIPNSPAANAGIRIGDVIVAVDGRRITTGEELLVIVENSGVGENLQLKVQRGNRTQQISLRTAELKDFS